MAAIVAAVAVHADRHGKAQPSDALMRLARVCTDRALEHAGAERASGVELDAALALPSARCMAIEAAARVLGVKRRWAYKLRADGVLRAAGPGLVLACDVERESEEKVRRAAG